MSKLALSTRGLRYHRDIGHPRRDSSSSNPRQPEIVPRLGPLPWL